MFPNEQSCFDYLVNLRWPDGYVCDMCKTQSKPWVASRNRLVCQNCKHKVVVTAGTLFEKTRTPLSTWFDAAWHVTTAKNGMSAKTLERTLGTSYHVAWMMLQRFRVAMVNSERTKLTGTVEVDETLVGGVEQGGKRGRGTDKELVVIAVEVNEGKGFGRVRMKHVPDASGDSLIPFIQESVSKDAKLITDGWSGYSKIVEHGYKRDIKNISNSDDFAHVVMPGVHRVASLLKRWILGTHQGSVSDMHLQSYLEEYTFRFNRRKSNSRGFVFKRLLEHAVSTKPIAEADIKGGYWSTDEEEVF
jgi:transposase-like protein/DNA-directed RNA polymerase subunit RPC12/RpoP